MFAVAKTIANSCSRSGTRVGLQRAGVTAQRYLSFSRALYCTNGDMVWGVPATVACMRGRSPVNFRLLAVCGNTHQLPSSCLKKNSARAPVGDDVSTHT